MEWLNFFISEELGSKLHPDLAPKNYYKSVAENKDVSKYVMMMSSAVSTLKADVVEALQGYADYAFLWEKDREEAVRVGKISLLDKNSLLIYEFEMCIILSWNNLTLKAPIATKVICFSRLLKCLRSLYGKQRGPRSDCSHRSSLFWVHAVCFYT